MVVTWTANTNVYFVRWWICFLSYIFLNSHFKNPSTQTTLCRRCYDFKTLKQRHTTSFWRRVLTGRRLNTFLYFTILGKIRSIYRQLKTIYGNKWDCIQAFDCFAVVKAMPIPIIWTALMNVLCGDKNLNQSNFSNSQCKKHLNTFLYLTVFGHTNSIYRHTKTIYVNIRGRIQAFDCTNIFLIITKPNLN